MKFLLALFLVLALAARGAETSREAKIAAALAEAEKFAAAEQWREALEAGNRLRTVCREEHGEEHPDSALAELFLGEVRDHLGEAQLAEAHFRRALAIQEKVLRPDAPEFLTTLTRLAASLKQRQAYDEAAGLLQRALDLQTKLRGAEDPETATAATNLARVLRSKRDYERAAALLEQALAVTRRTFGGAAPETIEGLRELAQVQELAGKLGAAELSAAERVVAVEACFGSASPELVSALSDWGRLAELQTHFTEAESRYQRALKIAEAIFVPDDPALAASLTQLGWCLRQLERYDEAQPLLQRALEARLSRLGAEHPDTAASYRNLGWILRLKRDFEGARPLFEKALAIREQALGAADPLALESLSELGDLAWLRGAYDEAAALLERRRYRLEETTGPASEATATAWHGLAVVYESAKRWSEATEAALRSLRLTEQRLGPADAQTLGELVLLSRICQAAGAFEPALAQYSRLVAWFGQHPEANGRSRAELLRQFAIATLRAGRSEAAVPLFRESCRVHEAVFGPSDRATLRSLGDLWTCYDETRQPALALEVARDLAARTETALGSDAVETAAVFDRLGQLCLTIGDGNEARKAFRRALDGRRRHFGDGSSEFIEALAQVAGRFEESRDFQTAVALRTERMGAVERQSGHDSEAAAAACGDLAMSYFRLRDLGSARGLFEQQLAMIEKRRGAGNVEALSAVARLGDVAVAARDWPAAIAARERLAAGCARHYGEEHLETGRARLLLGEALLASGQEAKAYALVPALRALAAAPDGAAPRAAAVLARLALRERKVDEARRWTQQAFAGPLARAESLAEAFTWLGDAWAQTGDEAVADDILTSSLSLLSHTAGDQDENTVALLERVGALRLRLGRAGAAELFERALAATQALNGAETPSAENLLGWLALARVQEGQGNAAREAARRAVELLRQTGDDADRRLVLAQELEAWTAWRAATAGNAEAAWDELASRMIEHWQWMGAPSVAVARVVAEARALAAP